MRRDEGGWNWLAVMVLDWGCGLGDLRSDTGFVLDKELIQ